MIAFRLINVFILYATISLGTAFGNNNFAAFNMKLIKAEYDTIQSCKSCVTELKKAYEKIIKEEPNFANRTKKRLLALNWIGYDLNPEKLEKKLEEVANNRLSIAPLDEDFYEKSRVIALLSESEIRKWAGKGKPLLLYYINGRADYHFSGEGEQRLEDFINLTGMPKGRDLKRVEAAKEILANLKALKL